MKGVPTTQLSAIRLAKRCYVSVPTRFFWLNFRINKETAREHLQLNPDLFTVLYNVLYKTACLRPHFEELLGRLAREDNVVIYVDPPYYTADTTCYNICEVDVPSLSGCFSPKVAASRCRATGKSGITWVGIGTNWLLKSI